MIMLNPEKFRVVKSIHTPDIPPSMARKIKFFNPSKKLDYSDLEISRGYSSATRGKHRSHNKGRGFAAFMRTPPESRRYGK
jgi:hypothetical protein